MELTRLRYAQVWPLIKSSPQRNTARDADAAFLLNSIIQRGPNAGFYGYCYGSRGEKMKYDPRVPFGQAGPDIHYFHDLSNSQYGVLGVWAIERAGGEIPQKYWEMVDKAWKDAQESDGGWQYYKGWREGITPSMTAAGIATLLITQDYLLLGRSWNPCTGGIGSANVNNGLLWMDNHIQDALGTGNAYLLYGIERIGAASGRKYFGTSNWFQIGADRLVTSQRPDGSWASKYGAVADSALCLLFLSRGRAPVMMNKLQYSLPASNSHAVQETDVWNERPRDVSHLARWAGTQVEGTLNWQFVNLSVSPDDLHDAPILYISGNEELLLRPEDVATLRMFVEQGGLILGNADCGSAAFSRSFQKLARQMFGKYEFRRLPPDHPIFTSEQYNARRWRPRPALLGLSNGVRELMILIPDADVGHIWQSDNDKLRPECFELGADIFQYSCDSQNLFARSDTWLVQPDRTQPSQTLKMARIQTDGNWDPEPAGWTRLAAILHNDFATALTVEPVKLGAGKLSSGYQLAHLTGTAKFRISPQQRKELKDYVDAGGTLVIDAAGGSADFAYSAQMMLKEMFGTGAAGNLLAPLPVSSPVFLMGNKLTSFQYRRYASRILGVSQRPHLLGIPVAGGRIGVFLSPEDLSAGLVGESVDGIVGYDPATATKLMTNILLYAQKPASTPVAAPPESTAPSSPVAPTTRSGDQPQ